MKVQFTKRYLIVVLLALFTNFLANAQDSTIIVKGKIVSNRNTPLTDISVSVEGENVAPVLTNQDGEFQVTTHSGDVWLIVTPIGQYKSKRVFLNSRQEILISLADDNLNTGYDELVEINRTLKRRDMVSSYEDIELHNIYHKSAQTIDQYLQDKVPGMLITSQSGMPGKGGVSFMRGIKSMLTNNTPLYIVDGIPIEEPGLFQSNLAGNSYSPLANIDPLDISSITVLKDQTVTALYGTKASNGVIMIETLKASAIETTIDVIVRHGLNLSVDYLPQLNGGQYKALTNEILASSNIREEFFVEKYPGLYLTANDEGFFRYQHNTNWQEEVFSNSTMDNMFVTVKGGGQFAQFGLSVGYIKHEGIFKNTKFDRFNVRFVGNMDVYSWLRLDISANLTNNNSFLRESALSEATSPILTSLQKSPLLNPYKYDIEGNRLKTIDEVEELGISNPTAVAQNVLAHNKNYSFISSIRGQADISQTLKWNTLMGINFNSLKEFMFSPNLGMELYYNDEANNVSKAMNNYLFSVYTDNYLSFAKTFSTIHEFTAYSGIRLNTNELQVDWGEGKNTPDNDQYTTMQSGQNDLRLLGGSNGKWNWMSLYGSANYKLRDKYILNACASLDYSTRTGEKADAGLVIGDLPFGVFYSAGVAWRLSNENFLKNIKALEDLTLRVSYGISGNDDIGNFSAMDYYELVRYRETSGLIQGSIPNETLKYETTNQINIGLDFSVWGDRTSLTANYYIMHTNDMFVYEPQQSYTGFRYRPTNGGSIANRGWELSLYTRLVDGKSFKWNLIFNLSHFTNEVTEIKGNELITPFVGGEFITREGEPINNFYGYLYEGVFASYTDAEAANLVNEKGRPYGAGDAKFKDLSGPKGTPDGIINNYDKTTLGSPVPDYFGSATAQFMYKRWSLDATVQLITGSEVYNYVRYQNERMSDITNQSTNVLKRWQFDGDKADVPRAVWGDPIGNAAFSSRWIEDGSFIRLKSVSLSYTIPDKFLVFKNADFFVTATNLLSWHQYLGYDPEFSYSYDTMSQGIDYGLMPQHRQFIFGIKFGL